MAIVQVQGLKKVFGENEVKIEALKGINLQVEQGEFICIMGASGSGKSTLLQLLGGLDRPTIGEVIIDGTKLSTLNERQMAQLRRRKIGFVFQSFNLIPVLSAEENVALPLLIDRKEQKKSLERATELLKVVGLDQRHGHRPGQLSGGQQQRVAIARALSTEPAILLADEPTGALDSVTSREIMHLLRNACDNLRQTVMIVTHDPLVAAYADRIIVLVDGNVADDFKLGQQWASRNIKERSQEVQLRLNKHLHAEGEDA